MFLDDLFRKASGQGRRNRHEEEPVAENQVPFSADRRENQGARRLAGKMLSRLRTVEFSRPVAGHQASQTEGHLSEQLRSVGDESGFYDLAIGKRRRPPRREQVADQLKATLETAGLDPATGRVEVAPDDQDQQSLLIWYPKVTASGDGYIRPTVKIESGAKSALDPNQPTIIRPYVTDVVPDLDLSVPNVTTVVASRSFRDKVVILHGLWQWYERRGVLRGGGQRISRHYYDLYRLLDSEKGRNAAQDLDLGAECVRHAKMFFNSPDLNLDAAAPGSFTLSPNEDMAKALALDYVAMSGMIFGPAPNFEDILKSIGTFETRLNEKKT